MAVIIARHSMPQYIIIKFSSYHSSRIHSLGVEYELPMFPSTLMLVVRVRVSVDAKLILFFVASVSLNFWNRENKRSLSMKFRLPQSSISYFSCSIARVDSLGIGRITNAGP